MSLDTFRAKAADIFLTKLAADTTGLSSLPVHIENQTFTPPVSGGYFYLYMVPYDGKRAAIGTTAKFQKIMEYIVVECFVPENSGTKNLNAMMDFAKDAFEESSFALVDGDTVFTYTAKPKVNGLQTGFYRGTVMVNAMRRTCKA